MTILEEIRREISDDLQRVNARIAQRLSTGNPLLQAIIDTNLRTKGKQIRPVIVILASRMLGGVNEKTIDSAAAVELIHNASLVHDDVVDAAPTRRGMPTVNAVWNNHIAVLVGDYFVSTSMALGLSTGSVAIVELLTELGRRLSLGELDQIYNARFHTLSEEAYFSVIDHKTASLFSTCARMAAEARAVDSEQSRALIRFASLLGLCFQVRDDIFDYFSGDPKLGKPTGNDLREGKITLPLIHVLLDSSIPGQPEMLALSSAETLTDAQIETLMAFARDNGGIDYAYACMQRMRDQAVECLSVFPPSPEKQWLTGLFDYIIARDY